MLSLLSVWGGGKVILEAGEDLLQAQQAARKASASGDEVIVRLEPRVYRLAETFELTAADSRVTWEGADGTTLSGMSRLGAWRQEPDGMWSAEVPFASAEPLNTLLVNGERRPRSRWPKGDALFPVKAGFWDPAEKRPVYRCPQDRFVYQPGELDPAWANLDEARVFFYHVWINTHLKIKSVDPVSNVVMFVDSSKTALYKPGWNDPRWYLENLRAVATEPGEWCHSPKEGRVYYRPKPGETMSGSVGEVPRVGKLLSVAAHDVVFRGVRFAGCRYALPPGDVNTQQAAERVPPAVEVRDGEGVVFERCAFEDLDGYALGFLGGTCRSAARGCRFRRLGAGGVKISARGSFSEAERVDEEALAAEPSARPDRFCRGNEVSDCEICWYGLTYRNAVGVLLMHADHTRITRNHIHDGWYTGISVGWTWGYWPTVAHHNEISYNHVHDIGKGCLSDMGGIYTLGVSPGTVLRGNVIHGVSAYSYGAHGLYHDEGSSYILDEDNLVYDTGSGLLAVHYGKELTVRNNIFAFGKVQMIGAGRDEDHVSVRFTGNIVYGTDEALYSSRWLNDREYAKTFGPKDRQKDIPCKVHSTADWNLLYLTDRTEDQAVFGDKKTCVGIAEWRKRGYDVHSVYADPLFVDPAKRDFRLRPDSPALKLGFRPFVQW